MAKLYLRGEVYWCWGYDLRGKRWRASTHQRDRRAAEVAARRIEIEKADPTQVPTTSPTLERAVSSLLDHLEAHGRSEHTRDIVEHKAGHVLRVLGDKTMIHTITPGHVEAYARQRLREEASPHTVQKEVRVVVQSLRLAARAQEYAPRVPPGDLMPRELSQAKVYRPRERWLTREEYAKLLAALVNDRREYVKTLVHTGVRLGELYRIEGGDVTGHDLHVRGTKTATSDRAIPLSNDAHDVLTRRKKAQKKARKAGPLFDTWHCIQRDLKVACKRAGIPPAGPNDLRRTFASWLVQAGVPTKTIAELMGHASTAMVERVYARLSRDALKDAVKAMDAARPRRRRNAGSK